LDIEKYPFMLIFTRIENNKILSIFDKLQQESLVFDYQNHYQDLPFLLFMDKEGLSHPDFLIGNNLLPRNRSGEGRH
jgi:hypothetical protein